MSTHTISQRDISIEREVSNLILPNSNDSSLKSNALLKIISLSIETESNLINHQQINMRIIFKLLNSIEFFELFQNFSSVNLIDSKNMLI